MEEEELDLPVKGQGHMYDFIEVRGHVGHVTVM